MDYSCPRNRRVRPQLRHQRGDAQAIKAHCNERVTVRWEETTWCYGIAPSLGGGQTQCIRVGT